jgi:hypothetical protein
VRNHKEPFGKHVRNALIFHNRVGIVLAVGSGVLIGASFVFKKKGLLSSQKGKVAGEGLDYLKSVGSIRKCCHVALIEGP